MLTTTAMVLLTMTATVAPVPVATMTTGEQKLFNQLVECGQLADKMLKEQYDVAFKVGDTNRRIKEHDCDCSEYKAEE
jgi:hypothetical protein